MLIKIKFLLIMIFFDVWRIFKNKNLFLKCYLFDVVLNFDLEMCW